MLFKGTRRLGTTDYGREAEIRRQIDAVARQIDDLRLRDSGDQGRIDGLTNDLRQLQEEARLLVVKDEIDALYTRNGARGLNASTSADLTTYKVSLPSNRLELWAAIEADRLREPVMREFYSERDVVVEERRQRFESDPPGRLYSLMLATAFQAHPYGRPIIGWQGDVDFLTASQAEDFFRRWYAPNNAVLTAVGDVEPEAFLDLVRRHFGGLTRQPLPAAPLPREPAQEGERRAVLSMDAEPRLMMAFHKPTLPSRQDYVMDLLDALLTGGRTSRLYRRLVEEDQIAVSVSTSNGIPGARYPNLFLITAVPRYPHTNGEVESALIEELARISRQEVPLQELTRVRKKLRADMLRGLQSNSGLAGMLSYFAAVAGDWRYIATHLDVLEDISPAEIRETAARYFTAKNRSVVTLEKEESGK
jgi:predicted Zn-dependent peptidase